MALRKFITLLSDDDLDGDEPQLVDDLEDVTAHVVEMNQNHNDDESSSDPVFSHLAITGDSNKRAAFNARLQDAAFLQELIADLPISHYASTFCSVVVVTSCAMAAVGVECSI